MEKDWSGGIVLIGTAGVGGYRLVIVGEFGNGTLVASELWPPEHSMRRRSGRQGFDEETPAQGFDEETPAMLGLRCPTLSSSWAQPSVLVSKE